MNVINKLELKVILYRSFREAGPLLQVDNFFYNYSGSMKFIIFKNYQRFKKKLVY